MRERRLVLQMLTLLHTKKCHFPHPFSDLVSKIHTHFQTWLLLPSLLVAQRDLCRVACITGVIFSLFSGERRQTRSEREHRTPVGRSLLVSRLPSLASPARALGLCSAPITSFTRREKPLFFGGREATTGNTSAVPRLSLA